ncbi:MAG: UDP-N-acetylmuramoyl-L-alanyl-D-glutamate--2,6-diaminopimelate ligase [Anaerolineales bacterium]|nr:UDP-N-acetylmuramoyl-L-alanyl-D-glutamate--2,6-diaminopimelate ligase [Anaerolineales bacterium]
MKLETLLSAVGAVVDTAPTIEITSITPDSRTVVPGALFVAVCGVSVDGHAYIQDAFERGAAVVIGEKPHPDLDNYYQVPDARKALGQLAAAWYGFPSQKLVLLGVTGTDGKTTTTNLLFHILKTAGFKTGMISTVNAVIGDQLLDTGFHVTTPDAMEVQRYLAQMVEAGLSHCVLEATSHGLGQWRVAGCDFDLAVVTNITHEHLDFHGSYDAYRAAKARLFELVQQASSKAFDPPRVAVLNRDDSSYEYLAEKTADLNTICYGVHSEADVRAQSVVSTLNGLDFEICIRGYNQQIHSNLYGDYNVSNILAAYTLTVEGLGLDPVQVAQAISSMGGIPGRMERIDLGQDFTAIVDFAHTPNALDNALHSARALTDGKVIAVFGSAGLRDRAKRDMMARVSACMADITILTAEDPRTESLDDILAGMAAAAEAEGAQLDLNLYCVSDRGDAIRKAVSLADSGDLVIACGKGHEQSMCFGETEYLWDDRTAMRAALAEHLHVDGPEMPYLPTSSS